MYPDDLVAAAEQLVARLAGGNLKLATAESCTGGLLAGLITTVPGSSRVFEYGFVTYADAAKTDLLGVRSDALARCGAVSPEVACLMAEGARSRARADIAIAITGIAGPDGGSREKPVGLVYIGRAGLKSPCDVRKFSFGAVGRREVRLASLRAAIAMLNEVIA